ncbi:hypothetical protein, partial [uncultured Allobaculum sp.]|uniref:hypothetical protein n=1 Tax=uncultured Allobaculum sp. TaxID=1187017 RepID=UPI002596B1F6
MLSQQKPDVERASKAETSNAFPQIPSWIDWIFDFSLRHFYDRKVSANIPEEKFENSSLSGDFLYSILFLFSFFSRALSNSPDRKSAESARSAPSPSLRIPVQCKRQIKDGYFLDRLLGIIPLFKEAFSWNQSSLQSISVSISPK